MKTRKGKGCLVVLFVIIVIGIMIAIISSGNNGSDLTSGKVTYIVEGSTTKANVNYSKDGGSQEQVADVTLPFEKTLEVQYGTPLVIIAQNLNDSGTITCRILVNGEEIQSATSEGGFVAVSCSGMNMPKP
jgi:hypothetical protein